MTDIKIERSIHCFLVQTHDVIRIKRLEEQTSLNKCQPLTAMNLSAIHLMFLYLVNITLNNCETAQVFLKYFFQNKMFRNE